MTGSPSSRLHRRLRSSRLLQRFTLWTRALLALGFLAPGLTKLIGRSFAPGIDPTTPMGAYFVAFHETGAYYALVGVSQIAASLLLLSRRTALLGALVYLPIIGNIFALVVATRFGLGTCLVAGSMTVACGWLLLWDGHRLLPIVGLEAPSDRELPREPALWDLLAPAAASPRVSALARCGFLLGFGAGIGLTLGTRGLALGGPPLAFLAGAAGGGLATLGAWIVHAAERRSGDPIPR